MHLLSVLRFALQAGGYDNRWDGSRPASRYESALASGLDGDLDEGESCCGRLQGFTFEN
jgi:hypothetical protein